MSGVVVANATQVPAGPERTDDVLGPQSGWVVRLGTGLRCRQLKPASTSASSAVHSRLFPTPLALGAPIMLATPTHPPHGFPIWMGPSQLQILFIGPVRPTFVPRPH